MCIQNLQLFLYTESNSSIIPYINKADETFTLFSNDKNKVVCRYRRGLIYQSTLQLIRIFVIIACSFFKESH